MSKYYIKFISISFLVFIFLLPNKSITSSYYQGLLDSLKMKVDTLSNDTLKVEYLIEIAFQYGTQEPRNGFDYVFKALELAIELKNEELIAWSYNRAGTLYESMGEHYKAIEYYNYALEHTNPIDTVFINANTYGNIGVSYANLGEDSIAYSYTYKCLEYYKALNMEGGIAYAYLTLSNKFVDNQQYDSADISLKYCLDLYKKRKSYSRIAQVYSNYSKLYEKKKDITKAIEYSQKAIKLNQTINDNKFSNSNKLSLAKIYIEYPVNKVQKDSIELLLKESIQHADSLSMIFELESAYLTLAHYLESKNKFEESNIFFNKVIKIKEQRSGLSNIIKLGIIESEIKSKENIALKIKKIRIEEDKKNRRDTIQYTIITILTIIAFLLTFYLSRKNISFGIIDTLTFITFLILYEFILVISEPWVDNITNEIPIYKLAINIAIVLLFIPLHKIENKIKANLKNKKNMKQ